MVKTLCSNGDRVSEATIKQRLSKSYKKWYIGEGILVCSGCGDRAIETSHIISKARCKQIHKTELIWDQSNTFPACRDCHTAWENKKLDNLLNAHQCLEILKKYDVETYLKYTLQ